MQTLEIITRWSSALDYSSSFCFRDAFTWYLGDESEKKGRDVPRSLRPRTISIKLWHFICVQICIIYEVPWGSASSLQTVFLHSGWESLCVLPDNTKWTDRALLFNVFHWLWLSVTCWENSVTSASGETGDFVKSSLKPLIHLCYYHNITGPFAALLKGAGGAFILIISIFRLIFMHKSAASPPSCALTDCPWWKCQNTS